MKATLMLIGLAVAGVAFVLAVAVATLAFIVGNWTWLALAAGVSAVLGVSTVALEKACWPLRQQRRERR